jgi:hypothetical protein
MIRLATYLRQYSTRQRSKSFNDSSLIAQPIIFPAYSAASPQAAEFHRSTCHIKYLFGGDRAGKTGTVGYELISLTRQFPGDLFWAVALTEDKLSAVWKWHKRWLSPHEIKHINWRVTEQIPKFVLLKNGGKIEYKMWAQGAGAFSADSVKAIQLDEDGRRAIATAEQVYNDCLSRITDCDGYILGGATPVLGKNWLYHRIFRYNVENRQDHTPDPDIAHWTVSLLDNKYIPLDLKMKAKGRMSADEVQRRFYGMFTTLEGAVYKEWREDFSVLKDFPTLPGGWRKAAAIDLGYNHPFVCLWGALSPDDTLYIYDEYYQAGEYMKTHSDHIIAHETAAARFFSSPIASIETRVSDHERQNRAELDYYGIMTEPADKKNKEENIQIANRLMMLKEDGKPGVFVAPWCHHLIDELGTLYYKETTTGKEEPIKINDDASDAFLYLCAYFFSTCRSYDIFSIQKGNML